MKCPYCTKPGEKKLVASNPGGASWVLCHTCGGTNEIPDERGRRMVIANDLRNARVGIRLSLREYAKVLEVSPTTLSHVEVGYLPTKEHLALWNKMTGESLSEVDR